VPITPAVDRVLVVLGALEEYVLPETALVIAEEAAFR
jgi:hypothetical protein